MVDADSPPPLDALDEIDGYWMEPTTITCSRLTKAHLDNDRNNQPWDSYLQELRRAKADPLTLSDAEQVAEAISQEMEIEQPEETCKSIIEDIRNQLSMAPEYGVNEAEIVEAVDERLNELETELKTSIEGLQE